MQFPVRPHVPRRRALLFLVAMLVPRAFCGSAAALPFIRDAASFFFACLSGWQFTQVATAGGSSNSIESALSPDGKTFYTNLRPGGGGSPGSSSIRAFDLETGRERLVFTAENGGIPGLGLSPDGRTLALNIVFPEKKEIHVCVVGIDGSNFRKLFTETSEWYGRVRPQLVWTKDGRSILFTRWSSFTDWELMRIPVEGGKPEFTGLTGKGTPGIDLSPDGSRIAFNDGTPGIPELWALDNLPLLKEPR